MIKMHISASGGRGIAKGTGQQPAGGTGNVLVPRRRLASPKLGSLPRGIAGKARLGSLPHTQKLSPSDLVRGQVT